MKRFLMLVLLSLIIAILAMSCQKDEITSPYGQVPEEVPVDTTTWTDGGTITTGNDTLNDLIGTTWVLTKYVTAFAVETPYDTIRFISNNEYTLNSGTARAYRLSNIPLSTNKELSLYFFVPFGGSHYSGQVGKYFIDDGIISNVEFTDIQNTSMTIQAWFQKQ